MGVVDYFCLYLRLIFSVTFYKFADYSDEYKFVLYGYTNVVIKTSKKSLADRSLTLSSDICIPRIRRDVNADISNNGIKRINVYSPLISSQRKIHKHKILSNLFDGSNSGGGAYYFKVL